MDISLKQQLRELGYTAGFDLSSLIEVCGEDFSVLSKLTDCWYAASDKTDFPGGNRIEVSGWATPEEAVARLYIAINKK